MGTGPHRRDQQRAAGMFAYLMTYDLPAALTWRMEVRPEDGAIEYTGVLPYAADTRAQLLRWSNALAGTSLTFDVFDGDDDAGGCLRLVGTFHGLHVRIWIGLADADEVAAARALLASTTIREAPGA